MVSTWIIYLGKGCCKLCYKLQAVCLKIEERLENLLLKQMK